MITSPKKELRIYHIHSKPEELADFLGEKKKKRTTLGEKREDDSSSLNVHTPLTSFTSTGWTFIISYLGVLVGGGGEWSWNAPQKGLEESKCKF